MPKTTANKFPTNVILDAADKRKLTALQEATGIGMGQILRMGMRLMYTMQVEKKPVCANGQTCLFPHAHPLTNPINRQMGFDVQPGVLPGLISPANATDQGPTG